MKCTTSAGRDEACAEIYGVVRRVRFDGYVDLVVSGNSAIAVEAAQPRLVGAAISLIDLIAD